MKNGPSILGVVGAIGLAMALIKLVMAILKLVRGAADVWADRPRSRLASFRIWRKRSLFAEPAAALFVCSLWAMADYFYKEALVLRSEVTGLPALLE